MDNKKQNIEQPVKKSKFRKYLFSFFGFLIIAIIIGTAYGFYEKQKREKEIEIHNQQEQEKKITIKKVIIFLKEEV